MEMEKKFINKDIEVFEGNSATQKLLEKNDKKYFTAEGVIKVDKERWEEAQFYEKKTWCNSPAKSMTTDRNEFHMDNFGNYSQLNFLLGNDISIIELGCGPYTNLRLIISQLYKKIKNITLLDPLINEYRENSPNCSYRNKTLNAHLVNLIPSTIEYFETSEKYDLIVMINVLEHCFDVDKIFDKIKQISNKAVFVFQDRFYKDEYIETSVNNSYDAGHPIKLTISYLRKQLRNFSIISERSIDNEDYIDYYAILKIK